MPRSPEQLREDLLAIWHAGVAAVAADRLVRDVVQVHGDELLIDEEPIDLTQVRRIAVVGAGKAGASMAAGLEAALGRRVMEQKHLSGWVNVPDDCVQSLERIYLHGGRPAGVNEPTGAGVVGTEKIMELVSSLAPNDLCIALISGGGSALLPAPISGISLEDKQAVTRFLSTAGANIAELNTVRKQLSRVKGGGLARACTAGRLITLIISDVIGDPLDLIASGPTVPNSTTAQDALAILEQYDARRQLPASIYRALHSKPRATHDAATTATIVQNMVIGNNAVAVDAAGIEAERRGYSHAMDVARTLEGPAEEIGRHHARLALRMRDERGPDCLITGGEPTVTLVDAAVRGKGGRNQQLVLAALEELLAAGAATARGPIAGIGLLAGGTDGEDGPTDAAGAYIDEAIVQQLHQPSASDYRQRNDAYHFFAPASALLKTGPTHTNVGDLRVVVVDRIETTRPGAGAAP